MKVLLVHPGTQHSHKLAGELSKHGVLYKFCTCFAFSFDSRLKSVFRLFTAFKRRELENVTSEFLVTFPFLEFISLGLIKIGFRTEPVLFLRNQIFQLLISRKLIQSSDVVIGFDTSSWIISKRCKVLGIPFVLDVSIGHPVPKNEIFISLINNYPEWSSGVTVKSGNLIEFEMIEIENANKISVPSEFVKDTYLGVGIPGNKIFVNAFGSNVAIAAKAERSRNILTFLFFGALTSRKGLPLLLDAWRKFESRSDCRLLVAGYGEIPSNVVLPANVEVMGEIFQDARAALFNMADVFVFPSYYEGFAQVLIEATASGLPVITTINAGGSELVENGKNGFLIETGSQTALIDKIEWFLLNRETISEFSRESKLISQKFTWANYGNRWITLLNKL